MSDPNDLSAFLTEGWSHLTQGVTDRNAPARFPTLCTVSADGKPQARTVALRAADPKAATVEIHTDVDTPKVAQLRQTPFAAVHIWVPDADLQIRLSCEVAILTGALVAAAWRQVPPESRVSYGTTPLPGTPISSVFEYEKPALEARFAVLACRVTEIDLVHLGPRHRRAAYKRSNGWQGTWLSP